MVEMKSENISWRSIPASGSDCKINIKHESSTRSEDQCGSMVKLEVKPFEQSVSPNGVKIVRSVTEKIPEGSQSYSIESHHRWTVSCFTVLGLILTSYKGTVNQLKALNGIPMESAQGL